MTPPTTLLLGVGNESRGDDAVGIVIARRIGERQVRDVVVQEVGLDGMLILEAWDGAESVVIVDAMSSGLEPGSIRRFDASSPIPARTFATSTHALGVAQAIELGRALDRLPGRLVVIGIEGERFEHGAGLSPAVDAAVDRAVDRVLEEITGWRR